MVDSRDESGGGAVVDPVANAPWYRALRALDRALGTTEQALLALLLILLIGVASGQAIMTLLGASWQWSYELIRYGVFFIAMTGAALSAHTRQLIAMDIVSRVVSPMSRARLRVVLRAVTIGLCTLLVIGGKALSDIAAGEHDHHIIPPQLGLLALPAGSLLIAVHLLLHGLLDLAYLVRGRVPPTELHAAAGDIPGGEDAVGPAGGAPC
jgi:TRAP-type C4-dicarboxylate transport system permease small subunit